MVLQATTRWKWALLAALIFAAPLLRAQQQDDVVGRAMKDELARSMSQLHLEQMEKPYFIAYRVQDITEREITATLGSLTSSSGTPTHNRLISVQLRVGDYSLDNSNFLSMDSLAGAALMGGIGQGPLDDNYAQIRRALWLDTDRQYKQALEQLSAKKAALKGRTGGENIPDFSKETPHTMSEAQTGPGATPNLADLEAMAREISSVFRSAPEINKAAVTIRYTNVYTRYLNSEGTSYARTDPLLKVEVSAQTQASDGLPISDSFNVYARTAADLPSRDALRTRAQDMSALILKLRSASTIDRYNGPVLFESGAAGEVFLQQLGSRLVTARTPMSDNSQFETMFDQMFDRLGGPSLQDKIGARVLPEFMSVRDEPLQEKFSGTSLLGASIVDDDGVMTRETLLVDHGILKNLLASRVPVRGVLQSTGSRHGWGAVASNLFVTSEKTMPDSDLKKELLRRAKDRGLDYALVVRRVGGGAQASYLDMIRQMQAGGANASSLAEVYKLFPDGHEEPVAGVHISDLSGEAFKEIVATGDSPVVYTDEVFPRMGSIFSMGFSSGGDLPVVSCICPALLFEEVSLSKTEGPFPAVPVSPSPLAEK
jgi:predicted Zn-dependent protease